MARAGYHSFNPVIIKKPPYIKALWNRFCTKTENILNIKLSKINIVHVSAWDKAVYYFCKINTSYEHVWFVEDDVFVPNINLFNLIDSKNQSNDILSSENVINESGHTNNWSWWSTVPKSNLELPWASSMVCAVRLSNKLLKIVNEYVLENKSAYKFIEYVFHTLALHSNLSVKKLSNLSGVLWRQEWNELDLNRETFYHPVKSIGMQSSFRKFLNRKKEE